MPAVTTKSSAAVAVPELNVSKFTVVSLVAALSRVIVKARVLVPESPSVTDGVSAVRVYFPSCAPLLTS